MVVLKNITSFRDFIFEASVPSEFSNETGFSQSLVGRGIFSLLRYIKQGVDYMRLEYLKRKLENEYFAGWLRYCALKQINLKEGTMPELPPDEVDPDDVVGGGGGNSPDEEDKFCNIFSTPINDMNSIQTPLLEAKRDLDGWIADTVNHTPEQIADFKVDLALIESGLTCCRLKRDLVAQALLPLKNLVTVTGFTYTSGDTTTIISYLDKILLFLDEAFKYCKKYKFMDDERTMLKTLKSCTSLDIKAKINDMNTKFASKSNPPAQVIQDNYQYVNEAITSGINKSIPIDQMLGDILSTDEVPLKAKPYEYLKKMGVNGVEDINFQKVADLWKRESLKDEATKLVNINGIKKIQYSASRYIYRIKKTPTYTGITPEKGGGVKYEEESALMTTWQKKVEKVKSEWANFLNMNTVDPFRLLSIQDAWRKGTEGGKDFNDDVTKTTNDIVALSKWKEIGLTLKGSSSSIIANENFIVECFVKGVKYNIILNMHKSDNPTVKTFRYVGNVDIKKMIDDEIWVKDPNGFQKNLKNYVAEISNPDYLTKNLNDIKTAFNFDVNNTSTTKISGSNHFLHGIYFITKQCDLMTVSKSDTDTANTANIKIVFFYTNKTSGPLQEYTNAGLNVTKDNFKIKSYKDGILRVDDYKSLNVADITDLNQVQFGRLAVINPAFKVHYFPTRQSIEAINGDDAVGQGQIRFK